MKYLWRHCYQRHCVERTYLFYVTIATVILSQVNMSCYLHTRRYVFCPKTHLVFNWCLCNRRESLLSYNHKKKIKMFFIYLLFFPFEDISLTLKSDWHLVSPYNIRPISNNMVLRIRKMITNKKLFDCSTNSPC